MLSVALAVSAPSSNIQVVPCYPVACQTLLSSTTWMMQWSWWIATGISLTAGILLLGAFVYHARKRRLLFIPTPPVVPGAAQPDPVMGQNVAMVH